ncbi:VOC family protein [Streptomyces sp. ADMS]|uniref:VOC family protein n=1 Tax=Streptomyces sp. ADMS TaxID=3071415 RepID=UPI00296E45FD|nr:VOC family protein [Streptomyces sp. ADMS]MDW4907559.1 VOC family protein [Streptomyces sp. ADMS]
MNIGTGNGTGIRWTYAFIDRPAGLLRPAHTFWTAVSDTRVSETRGEHGEFVTLLPGTGDACVKVQGVASGDGGAHLDLAVEDVDAFVGSASALGATVVGAHTGWAVLRSPAGQLFCAVPWHGETVRPAVVDGSRLDQVSIDIPPTAYDTEVAFWERLTAWDSLTGSLPEFHVLRPPAHLPVRILLQRLGTERPAASAHLDLACADIGATRARHERLGATAVSHGTHWTVMRDPAEGTYCLTGRDPETGGLPKPTAADNLA